MNLNVPGSTAIDFDVGLGEDVGEDLFHKFSISLSKGDRHK
jgi:hypothetical protein